MRKEITPQNTGKIFNLNHSNIRRRLFTGAALLFIFMMLPLSAFPQYTLNVSDDTYVDTSAPNASFGNSSSLKLGYTTNNQGAITGTQRVWLRFNISTLPSSLLPSDVSQAVLRLYVNKVNSQVNNVRGAISYSPDCNGSVSYNPNWLESNLTYNNGGGCNPYTFTNQNGQNFFSSGVPISSANQYVFYDVTQMLKLWLWERTYYNNGRKLDIVLEIPFSNAPTGNVVFDSKESGGNAPIIEINQFQIRSVTGANGLEGSGNSGDVVLGITNGGVTTARLADGAVTSAKIANGAVGNPQLANNSVATNNIAPGAVNNLQLADNSVTSNKISVGAVTTNQLSNAAVTETKLADNSVTNTKITNGAVTETKLADGSITNAKIADGSIQAGKIGAGQIVKNLNGLTDSVNLVAGTNVTISPSGNSLTISANSTVPNPLVLTGGTLTSPVDAVIQGTNGGDRYGVAGYSTYGIGIYGKSFRSQKGIGVYGEAVGGGSDGGIGVFGRNDLHLGVMGQGSTGVFGFGNTGNVRRSSFSAQKTVSPS